MRKGHPYPHLLLENDGEGHTVHPRLFTNNGDAAGEMPPFITNCVAGYYYYSSFYSICTARRGQRSRAAAFPNSLSPRRAVPGCALPSAASFSRARRRSRQMHPYSNKRTKQAYTPKKCPKLHVFNEFFTIFGCSSGLLISGPRVRVPEAAPNPT